MPWHPRWDKAKVVPPEEFVTRQEAKKHLGLRLMGTVNMRIAHGSLEGAVLGEHTADPGVTRTSLDAEVRWWQDATLKQRCWRHARTVINNF